MAREQWAYPAARAGGSRRAPPDWRRAAARAAPPRPRRRGGRAEGYTPAPRGTLSRLGAVSSLLFAAGALAVLARVPARVDARARARGPRAAGARAARAAAAARARGGEAHARAFAARVLGEIASRVPDMGTDARRTLDMTVFACLCVIPVLFAYVSALRKSGLRVLVLLAGATCFVCYYATRRLTGTVQRLTLQRGMFGYDINKKGTPAGDVRVPEAAGLAPAAVFLASLSVLQVAHMWLGGEGAKEWAVEHNSALATIGFAVFLGFVDDVLELPWRAKMILPAFAAMPLLLSYAGSTTILVPRPLRRALELVLGAGAGDLGLLDLGPLYYVYMFLLTIFCTNSINIHAGINGLEAGQSAVIAAAMVLLNVCTIAATGERAPEVGQTLAAAMTPAEAMKRALALRAALGGDSAFARSAAAGGGAGTGRRGRREHARHLLAVPHRAVSGVRWAFGAQLVPLEGFRRRHVHVLRRHALGVAGILGHFSETLRAVLPPQIVNLHEPQLFKLVPCPRHRLPRLDIHTGLLHPSFVTQEEGETRVNMNLVNAFLQMLGPQTERTLCLAMLTLQAGCCAAGFGVRAILTGVWK